MRVRIHPAFAAYLLSIIVLRSPVQAACAVMALLAHEGAHLLAATWTGERFSQVEITPFGGMMTFERGTSPAKGLRGMLVAAAGPAGNYLFLSLLALAGRRFSIPEPWLRQMIGTNAVMMAVNLLPALPLDGGRIIFCAAYYVMGVSRLLRVLSGLGMALGGGMLLLGAYGAAKMGVINVSMLIVGGYLIACAASSREAMLSENTYAVVQERRAQTREKPQRMTLYRVSRETPLYALLGAMDRSSAAAFLVEGEAGEGFLSERALLRALLESGGATVADALAFEDAQREGGR